MRELWRDEDAMTTVEYAMILVAVSTVAFVAWMGLGGSVRNVVQATQDIFSGNR